MARLSDKDHLWYDMKVKDFQEVEVALRAIERWANETSFAGGGYWTYDQVVTGRLEVDQTQVPGITEIYITLPNEDSYLYFADFGLGSQLAELVAVEDLFITAGEDIHLLAQIGQITLDSQSDNIVLDANDSMTLTAQTADISINAEFDITSYSNSGDIDLYSNAGEVYIFGNDRVNIEAVGNINVTSDTGDVSLVAQDDIYIQPSTGAIHFDRLGRWHSGEWKKFTDQGDISGTLTLVPGGGNYIRVRMTGNITTVNFTAGSNIYSNVIWLTLIQDGTGGWTVTWPASVKWPGGVAPTLTAAANGVDRIFLESFDAGTTWYANTIGLAFA